MLLKWLKSFILVAENGEKETHISCGAAGGFAEPLAGAGSENIQNAGSVT